MKKLLYYIVTFALLVPMTGCEKEMHSYRGDRGVYFAVRWGNPTLSAWPYRSYTNFDFVQHAENTVTAEVKVMITDQITPYDREFLYQIDADSTTGQAGVHYEIPDGRGVIPAGAVEGVATVVLHRTADMEKEVVKVALQLLPNENFDAIFQYFISPSDYNATGTVPIEAPFNASKHQLRITDVLVQPSQWIGGFNSSGAEFNSFGAFSPKKIRVMYELFDLTYPDFQDASLMTFGYRNVIGTRLGNYLTEQYRNRTPLLEDDGRLMWATGCAWTSYRGVPWDGVFNPSY